MVVVERVSGTTYVFNGISRASSGEHFEVDAWCRNVTRKVDNEKNGKSTDKGSMLLDFDEQEASVVLSLCGDFLTLHCLQEEEVEEEVKECEEQSVRGAEEAVDGGDKSRRTRTVARSQSMHIGMLTFEEEAYLDQGQVAMNAYTQNPFDTLNQYRKHVVRLVLLKDYLENNRPLVERLEKRHFGHVQEPSANEVMVSSTTVHVVEPISLVTPEAKFVAFLDPESKRVARLRGLYRDRTILDLCLLTKTVSALLPDGVQQVYSLEACLQASDLHDPLTSRFLNSHAVGPSLVTARHLHELLAFHRWALTPPELRAQKAERDQQTCTMAQAAVLEAQRYLLMLKLRHGEINCEQAASSSNALQSQLRASSLHLDVDFASSCENDKSSAPLSSSSSPRKEAPSQPPSSTYSPSKRRFPPPLSPSASASSSPSQFSLPYNATLHHHEMRTRAKQAISACESFLEAAK